MYDVSMVQTNIVQGSVQPSVLLKLSSVVGVIGVSVAWWILKADPPTFLSHEDRTVVSASTTAVDAREVSGVQNVVGDPAPSSVHTQTTTPVSTDENVRQAQEVASHVQGLMIELDEEAPFFTLTDVRGSTTGMRMFDFCLATSPVTAMREEQCIAWGVPDCTEVTKEMVSELCRGPYDRPEEVPNSGVESFGSGMKIHVTPSVSQSPYRVTFESDALVYQVLTIGGAVAETPLSRIAFPMGARSRATFKIEVIDKQLNVRQVQLDLLGNAEQVYTLSHKGVGVDTTCTILRELLARATLPDTVRTSLARDIDALRAYAVHKDAVVRTRIESGLSTYVDAEAIEYANMIRALLDEV